MKPARLWKCKFEQGHKLVIFTLPVGTLWCEPGLPGGLSGKEPACQCRRRRFSSWVRKIPGEGNSNPLQFCWLGSPMDRGAWQAIGHGIAESWHTNLSTKNSNSVSSRHWGHESPGVCCVLFPGRSVCVSSLSFTGVAVTLTAKLCIGKSFRKQ